MSNSLLGRALPDTYQEQLTRKLQLTEREFSEFFLGDIDCFASPASHYRMRAEFRIWHDDEGAHYAM